MNQLSAQHPRVCQLRTAVEAMNKAELDLTSKLPAADAAAAAKLAQRVVETRQDFEGAFDAYEALFGEEG